MMLSFGSVPQIRLSSELWRLSPSTRYASSGTVIGPKSLWGLVGLVPLLTGAIGFCPLYRLFGVSTARNKAAP